MISAGVIGFSEQNGHPFSFAAIINGYDRLSFKTSGWDVILDYLDKQPRSNFGINNVNVTHAWSEDYEQTTKLAKACKIPNPCIHFDEMLEAVDAVMIARDDWENHYSLAIPFLKRGIPVFVDKPLSLSKTEVGKLTPYIKKGKLMSCSGFRFASELDEIRNGILKVETIKQINATVLNDLPKYGIHLLDAIFGMNLKLGIPETITKLNCQHDLFYINFSSGVPLLLGCLGNTTKTFQIDVFTQKRNYSFTLSDNFTAFKRTLETFFRVVETGPIVKISETGMDSIDLLITMNNMTKGQKISIEN